MGTKRIGVALSDDLGLTAQPLTILERKGDAADVLAIQHLVRAHQVDVIVLGLPLTLTGLRGAQAQRVRAFAKRLEPCVEVPVRFIDERMTTAQGERLLITADVSRRRRKQVLDQVAAQLILQQFLDATRRE